MEDIRGSDELFQTKDEREKGWMDKRQRWREEEGHLC